MKEGLGSASFASTNVLAEGQQLTLPACTWMRQLTNCVPDLIVN
jgi:hypothetical protein